MKTLLIILGIILGLIGTLLSILIPMKKYKEDPAVVRDDLLYHACSELSKENSISVEQKRNFEHYEKNVWQHNKKIKRWFIFGILLIVLATIISLCVIFL